MNAATGRKRPAEGYPPHPAVQAAVPRTRKKPTDKTLPKMMEELQPEEYKLYNQLREAEARIDATILRKRFDLLDALNRPLKVLKSSGNRDVLMDAVSEEDTDMSSPYDVRSTMAINASSRYVSIRFRYRSNPNLGVHPARGITTLRARNS